MLFHFSVRLPVALFRSYLAFDEPRLAHIWPFMAQSRRIYYATPSSYYIFLGKKSTNNTLTMLRHLLKSSTKWWNTLTYLNAFSYQTQYSNFEFLVILSYIYVHLGYYITVKQYKWSNIHSDKLTNFGTAGPSLSDTVLMHLLFQISSIF